MIFVQSSSFPWAAQHRQNSRKLRGLNKDRRNAIQLLMRVWLQLGWLRTRLRQRRHSKWQVTITSNLRHFKDNWSTCLRWRTPIWHPWIIMYLNASTRLSLTWMRLWYTMWIMVTQMSRSSWSVHSVTNSSKRWPSITRSSYLQQACKSMQTG